jgi:hypothetical protein
LRWFVEEVAEGCVRDASEASCGAFVSDSVYSVDDEGVGGSEFSAEAGGPELAEAVPACEVAAEVDGVGDGGLLHEVAESSDSGIWYVDRVSSGGEKKKNSPSEEEAGGETVDQVLGSGVWLGSGDRSHAIDEVWWEGQATAKHKAEKSREKRQGTQRKSYRPDPFTGARVLGKHKTEMQRVRKGRVHRQQARGEGAWPTQMGQRATREGERRGKHTKTKRRGRKGYKPRRCTQDHSKLTLGTKQYSLQRAEQGAGRREEGASTNTRRKKRGRIQTAREGRM